MDYKTAAQFVIDKGFVVGDVLFNPHRVREHLEILYVGKVLVVVKDQDNNENAYYYLDAALEKLTV